MVDAEPLRSPLKFQVNIKIQLNTASVSRLSFRFLWPWLMRWILQLSVTSLSEKWLPIMISDWCGICEKTIEDDKDSSIILCGFCNSWIHPKCNNLNFLNFQRISGNNSDPCLCFNYNSETFPFGNLNNQNFHSCIHNNFQISESSVGKYTNDSYINT